MKPHQSIRLFKNPLLEALTHVHPSTPFVFWIPVTLYIFYRAFATTTLNPLQHVLLMAAGLFFWTITEYVLHRYVFHFQAKTKVGKYLVFLFHGIHHDDPQDPTRLVMPLTVSIPLATLFFMGFKAVMGFEFALTFFAAFMVGYMVYDYVHYAVHHFQQRTAWGRYLKENHMKHHYVGKEWKWGVSTLFWDRVFNTHRQ